MLSQKESKQIIQNQYLENIKLKLELKKNNENYFKAI